MSQQLVCERKHLERDGEIEGRVFVDEDGCYTAALHCYHQDGRQLQVRVSEETCSFYDSAGAAREAADSVLRTFMGHACSVDCEAWPSQVTSADALEGWFRL